MSVFSFAVCIAICRSLSCNRGPGARDEMAMGERRMMSQQHMPPQSESSSQRRMTTLSSDSSFIEYQIKKF